MRILPSHLASKVLGDSISFDLSAVMRARICASSLAFTGQGAGPRDENKVITLEEIYGFFDSSGLGF